MKIFTKITLLVVPGCLVYIFITLLTISSTTAGTEITIGSLEEHISDTVENTLSSTYGKQNSENQRQSSNGSKKGAKNRRRHKNKNKRAAKQARLLRSEAEQFGFVPTQGGKTLGLQWVLDIRRNLTTLMKGLEQVEQQLTAVKEQLQQKSTAVGETQSQLGSQTDSTTGQQGTSSTIVCPWEMLNGGQFNKCYSFHNNDRRSWYQAAASCRVAGGRLLRISSAQETAFLLSRAPAWMSSGTAWLSTTWTDGNRLYPCPNDGNSPWPSETSWGWGTRLDRLCFDQLVGDQANKNPIKVYTDWLMSADAQAGACVALAVASTNWEALDCDRPAAYVCERDPVQSSPILLTSDAEGVSSTKITAEQEEEQEDDRLSNDSVAEYKKQDDTLQTPGSEEITKGPGEDAAEQGEEQNDYTSMPTEKSKEVDESVKVKPEEA